MPSYVLDQSSIRHPGSLWAIVGCIALWLAAVHMMGPPQLRTISVEPMDFSAANALQPISFLENGTSPRSLPFNAPIDGGQAKLFGMETEPVAPRELSEKWDRVRAAIADDFAVLAQCHAKAPCPLAAQKLIEISATGAGRSSRARVGLINRAADLAISPTSDQVQWGVADHWSAPLETLRSNRGDCEDYAIVKYAALLEAGIPKDDVKIIILKKLFPNEEHAAIATRVDGQWLILDNRTLTMVRDTDVTRAIPEFVLDHQGVKRFNWASRNGRVAS